MSEMIPVSIVVFYKNLGPNSTDLWVQERKESGPLNGLWEFPGGKIEHQENPHEAAKREVYEEVGIEFSQEVEFEFFKLHKYSHLKKTIALNVYTHKAQERGSLLDSKGKWIKLNFKEKSESLKGTIPPVNHFIIDEILESFEKRIPSKLSQGVGL
jgi:8-oxo-dGTP diphosphatase